jgi:hypothetical protein
MQRGRAENDFPRFGAFCNVECSWQTVTFLELVISFLHKNLVTFILTSPTACPLGPAREMFRNADMKAKLKTPWISTIRDLRQSLGA